MDSIGLDTAPVLLLADACFLLTLAVLTWGRLVVPIFALRCNSLCFTDLAVCPPNACALPKGILQILQ
jgi:hypothetical protein